MKHRYMNLIPKVAVAALLLCASCQSGDKSSRFEIKKVEGGRMVIDSTWEATIDENLVALVQPYKDSVDRVMNEKIGVSAMKLERERPESPLSNLVAEVLRLSAQQVLGQPADVGLVNMGGIRNILPQGDITVKNVFEILPFENSLCVLTLKGAEVEKLMATIASLKGEGLSGARIEMTEEGKLLKATVQGKAIDKERDYTVATIDYLADGNDGFTPLLQAHKRVCPEGATLRNLFMDYIRQQTAAGKQITSAVDGRVKVVAAR